MQKYNHVPFGWRQHLITWKPTGFYSGVNTRDCLKFRKLNTKWLLLPRWLASTPIQIYVHQVKSQVHPTLVGDASLGHGPEGFWHRYPHPEAVLRGPATADGG